MATNSSIFGNLMQNNNQTINTSDIDVNGNLLLCSKLLSFIPQVPCLLLQQKQ